MDLFGNKRRQDHRERLVKAAGVSTVDLVCNDDTWAFIHKQCTSGLGTVTFDEKSPKRRDDNLIEIPFSGPKLVKLLTQLRITSDSLATHHPSWAVAVRVYDAVGDVIDRIDLNKPEGARIPPVIIDARLSTE